VGPNWTRTGSCQLLSHLVTQPLLRAAQKRSVSAQVKAATAQVWKRNGHLVRSVLAIVYIAIKLKDIYRPAGTKAPMQAVTRLRLDHHIHRKLISIDSLSILSLRFIDFACHVPSDNNWCWLTCGCGY
jgi:hypothetical protein